MRILIALLTILFVLLLVALTLLNLHERVVLSLWVDGGADDEIPLYWVLWGATLSGVVFTGLIAVLEGLHLRLANGRLRRQVNRLREELDDLRSLPLRETGSSGGLTGSPSSAVPGGHGAGG